MKRAAPWLALALVGCADNAFLELELVVPAAATCPDMRAMRHAGLEARFASDGETGCSRDVVWGGAEREAFVLDDAPATHFVDVEAVGADIDRPLCLRVLYCADDACTRPGVYAFESDPSALVRLERAFVLGRRTALTLALEDPCVAPETELPGVAPCDVRGVCE